MAVNQSWNFGDQWTRLSAFQTEPEAIFDILPRRDPEQRILPELTPFELTVLAFGSCSLEP